MRAVFSAIGLAAAIGIIALGFFTVIPDKEISYFSYTDGGYEEYVGGDAYNIMIEASLRGGEIAGAKTQRAVFISVGFLLLVISGLSLSKVFEDIKEEDRRVVPAAAMNVDIETRTATYSSRSVKKVECPACHKIQSSFRNDCYNCDVKFVYEDND